MKQHSNGTVPAPPQPGNLHYRTIEPAPGRYVRRNASDSKFEILQIEFPDTVQKFLVLRNLFPDNSLRELREKSLQHSRILHQTWLGGRQNRKIPCKIPC